MPINMTILLLQITQISNMKVIGFMVDFLKKLPLTIELNTSVSKFDHGNKINDR